MSSYLSVRLPNPQSIRSKNLKQKFFFSIFFIIFTSLSIILSQFIVAFLFKIFFKEKIHQAPYMAALQASSYLLALLFLIILPHFLIQKTKKLAPNSCLKKLKTSLEEVGLQILPTWTDIGLAPIVFIAYIFTSGFIAKLLSNFTWFDANQTQNVGFSTLFSASDRIIAFVALAVIAPIAEEIIFRGWLYGKLRSKLYFLPAILIVSALFGLLHGQLNVGIDVFVMSLFVCSQREITGTIHSGILLHIIKNSFAFFFLFIANQV